MWCWDCGVRVDMGAHARERQPQWQGKICVARLLRCLHCRLTARRSWVRFPLLALRGRSPPDLQCSGMISRGPFCVEFACSSRVYKGFPPLRTPTVKTCKITELMSIPDQRWTVHFTWSPGAAKLPTAPGGSLRKDGPGWEKAENKFTSGLPACVCVLCRLHICTCVFQCVVCAIKNLTKVLIIIIS